MTARLEIIRKSIVDCGVEAIVNAANPSLLGGGGVDGVIHRAAGPGLVAECRLIGGGETGQSYITGAYDLAANYVIHTIGPVWKGGDQGEAALLASCYETALDLAEAHGCASIAFPAISTGAYSYPPELAAGVAVAAIGTRLPQLVAVERVVLACIDRQTQALLQRAVQQME